MAGTPKTSGPTALSNTLTTNVYNNTSALIYDVVKSIMVTNKTAGAVTFTLYKGATGANAAGTELWTAVSIPANTTTIFYPAGLVLKSTDFLVGGASAATSLVFTMNFDQHVVP